MANQSEFERELTTLINKSSLENESDTPDYLLARYLLACLNAYNDTVKQREGWKDNKKIYNKNNKINNY